MTEPQIRYCTSADGTRIAYTSMGDGPPLITVRTWAHSPLSTPMGSWVRLDRRISAGRRLIEFDRRGIGSSQREVVSVSAEAHAMDIEAVANELGLDRFDLWGDFDGAAASIVFAAQHPKRLSRLVVMGAYTRGEDLSPAESLRSLGQLVRTNWGLGRRAIANIIFPRGPLELQRFMAGILRECVLPEVAARYIEEYATSDVRHYLPRVEVPTLVLQASGDYRVPATAGTSIAALIPDARLATPEGLVWAPASCALALDFFDEGYGDPEAGQAALPSGMTAILFLDIADSTALTTKLGDAAYRERERALDASLRKAITDVGGSPVEGKVLGDGIMAVFSSARQAIAAAQRCRDLGNEADLSLHLGIHAGDVVREGNNVHGGAVQVASRVQSAAAPGEILVSDIVRDLARTSAGVTFEDRGEHELKGIEDPVRLYEVRWSEDD